MIIKTNQEEILDYQKDASNFKGNCEQVFIPTTKDDLKKAISLCYKKDTPFTIAGARTGLGGGSVALEGAVISTEKLTNTIRIDTEKKLAYVQAGVLHIDIDDELNHLGLFFPPNPTEKNSSIGGNISTNASGSRTFKYGTTRDYVESLVVILSNGDEVHLHRGEFVSQSDTISFTSLSGEKYFVPKPKYKIPKVKHSAGYFSAEKFDAIDLFIGSEGTLGVVSDVVLRIIPRPENVFAAIIFFDNIDNLFDFLDIARDKSKDSFKNSIEDLNDISARLIEFFDDQSLDLLREKNSQIPEQAKAAIWIEQEYSSNNLDILLDKWYNLISEYTTLSDSTWMAMSESEKRAFSEFRHLLPLTVVDILSRNNMRKFGTDIAVPSKYTKDIYNFLRNEIENSGLQNAMWGHIGNAHFHANVMAKDDSELHKAHTFFDNCMTEAIRLGGTISGEHGIGKLKKKYLLQMFGKDGIEQMIAIKKTLDPKNLLCKGNVFDV